jgi:vacuolar protein sorting-associated protein 11
MKYATVLLEHCPKDTTQLFINYYTGQFSPKKDAVVIPNAPSSQNHQGVGLATSAVQNLAALLPLPYMSTNALQSPGPGEGQKTTVSQAQVVETSTDEPPAEYKVPKPRTAFSAFVDHPFEFIFFLEACIKSENLGEDDKSDLYTTLFEMYIHLASSRKDNERYEWEVKAKKLIDGKNVSI